MEMPGSFLKHEMRADKLEYLVTTGMIREKPNVDQQQGKMLILKMADALARDRDVCKMGTRASDSLID